jgi:hypothetical protein
MILVDTSLFYVASVQELNCHTTYISIYLEGLKNGKGYLVTLIYEGNDLENISSRNLNKKIKKSSVTSMFTVQINNEKFYT